jgi:hypothetical protein
MVSEIESRRTWAYVLIALGGFIAGLAIGQWAAVHGPGGSRVQWPTQALPHPRSLEP